MAGLERGAGAAPSPARPPAPLPTTRLTTSPGLAGAVGEGTGGEGAPRSPSTARVNLFSARSRAAPKGDLGAPLASVALGRRGGSGGGGASPGALKGARERPSTAFAAGRRGDAANWRLKICGGRGAAALPLSPPAEFHCIAASGFIVVAAKGARGDGSPVWVKLWELLRAGTWALLAVPAKRSHMAPMASSAARAPTTAPAIAPVDSAPSPPAPPPPLASEGRADGSAAMATAAVMPPASELLLTPAAVASAPTKPHRAGDARPQQAAPLQEEALSGAASAPNAVDAADARSAMSPTIRSALTSGSGGMNTARLAFAPALASRRERAPCAPASDPRPPPCAAIAADKARREAGQGAAFPAATK